MKSTVKQLRTEPGRIIPQASGGQEITVTYRGKPRAKIVPIADINNPISENSDGDLFGLWKNRKDTGDVDKFVRNLRKGRTLQELKQKD